MAKKKKNQHVVPHDGGWAIKGEGNSRATSVHNTQREAIDAAREIARNQGGELLIHRRDGRIREKDSTGGHDPYPPRDRGVTGNTRGSVKYREILFPTTPRTTSDILIKEAVNAVLRTSKNGSLN